MALRVFRHYVSSIKVVLSIIDFGLMIGTSALFFWLRLFIVFDQMPGADTALMAGSLIALTASPVMIGFGIYDRESLTDYRVFIIRFILALLLTGLILSALLFLLPAIDIWRSSLAASLVGAFLIVAFSHLFYDLAIGSAGLKQKVLILGAGHRAEAVVAKIQETPESGLLPVCVQALPNDQPNISLVPLLAHGQSSFLENVARFQPDMILVAAAPDDVLPLEDLISLRLSGGQVIGHQSFFEEISGYVKLEDLRAEWLIFAEGFKGASFLVLGIKRALDIIIATLVLLLSLPLTLAAAIAVFVTSKGSVFYRQQRVGLNGACFEILKFRTMKQDAEKETGARWASSKDPRITQIGAILRKTRIDEIPQAINVLKGDMSFVGPRPERPEFVDVLVKEIPFYAKRHCVKPGITGWAQIRFPYGASVDDSRRKLEYDLYYIKNYSIFLDLLIILQTARVVLFQKGAR